MIDVKLQDVGPCKKLLKICVPKADIQAKLDESYETLRQTTMVDGFRKTHVPRRLLEKRFGEQVIEDVKQSLLAEASNQAIEKEGLNLLGEPSFENAEFKPDEDFTFEVIVEVKPTFEINDYKGLTLERPAIRVTDDEMEQGLQNVVRQRAEWKPVAGGVVEEGDRLICDWVIEIGDEVVSSADDKLLAAEPGMSGFTSLGVQNLAEPLKGAKVGETRTTKVVFPEDYANAKYAGKEGVLSITPKEIQRAHLPELNEALAKGLDFDSVAELREEVKRQLQARKQREADEDLEQQLRDKLLDKVNFDLPEGIVKRQAREYMNRQQMHLRVRGVPEEEIQKQLLAMRAASEEAATRNFKLYFILERIADQEKIFVTENEVENMIAAMASRYQTSAHKLTQELEQAGSLSSLRHEMRRDKVVKFLLEAASLQDSGS